VNYQPSTYRPLTFFDAREAFQSGTDSPEAYLDRCLATINEREPTVKGWVVLNEEGARQAAAASAARYKAGTPRSRIDGMPIGIKDLIETKDMPTQMGSPAFEGNFPKRDSAIVRALRDAGAIVLGKTVTTALGFLDPGPTTNPFDASRTPGGSSSGSGAVVGAGMVPVAIGSQLVGSILRPASFSANWAIKPTFGAINRGERLGFSQSHLGVHAGSAIDMWETASEIVLRAGGDPGHPGLRGAIAAPSPVKPATLAVFEPEHWHTLDTESLRAFEEALDTLAGQGVTIKRRADSAKIAALERAIADCASLSMRIIAREQYWSLQNLIEQHPGTLGPSLINQLKLGESVSLEDYRGALLQRDAARKTLSELANECDALISLTAVGPAPRIDAIKDSAYPTGDVSFSCVSSLLGAPAVNVPALAVAGMPLGIQILGQWHADETVAGIGNWVHDVLVSRNA